MLCGKEKKIHAVVQKVFSEQYSVISYGFKFQYQALEEFKAKVRQPL